jgi:alpha-glucuronidase
VLTRLQYQSGHAVVWRDAVVNWFNRISGIPDQQNRVGNHPDRIEAENMQLSGYVPVEVTPWETASGGKGVACNQRSSCSASFDFQQADGTYDIVVQYFDQKNGVSHFQLFVNDRLVDSWAASDDLPATTMNGDSSTRRTTSAIPLHTHDHIRIMGQPNGEERAPLDYISITPQK